MRISVIKIGVILLLFFLGIFSACIQQDNNKKSVELPLQPTTSTTYKITPNETLEISDQANTTALVIVFNNSEVNQSLSGLNYTVLDVGPGMHTSTIENRELMRVDIDTDRALLTIWVDVPNRSVVYIDDYPKRV
jgi:hypothetical protein